MKKILSVAIMVLSLCGFALAGDPFYEKPSIQSLSTDMTAVLARIAAIEALTNSAAAVGARVATLEGKTNLYNKASSDAVSATNGVASLNTFTPAWNQAALDGTSATGGVASLNASAAGWNQAKTDASYSTNLFAQGISTNVVIDTTAALTNTATYQNGIVTGNSQVGP